MPSVFPGHANTHMLHTFVPTILARQVVLDAKFVRDGQNQSQSRNGNRSPHTIGRNRQHDTMSSTCWHIYVVIADPESSDDSKPLVAFQRFGRQRW